MVHRQITFYPMLYLEYLDCQIANEIHPVIIVCNCMARVVNESPWIPMPPDAYYLTTEHSAMWSNSYKSVLKGAIARLSFLYRTTLLMHKLVSDYLSSATRLRIPWMPEVCLA